MLGFDGSEDRFWDGGWSLGFDGGLLVVWHLHSFVVCQVLNGPQWHISCGRHNGIVHVAHIISTETCVGSGVGVIVVIIVVIGMCTCVNGDVDRNGCMCSWFVWWYWGYNCGVGSVWVVHGFLGQTCHCTIDKGGAITEWWG